MLHNHRLSIRCNVQLLLYSGFKKGKMCSLKSSRTCDPLENVLRIVQIRRLWTVGENRSTRRKLAQTGRTRSSHSTFILREIPSRVSVKSFCYVSETIQAVLIPDFPASHSCGNECDDQVCACCMLTYIGCVDLWYESCPANWQKMKSTDNKH